MRIPKSEFTDADLKLCRAHGDAVEQDHYSRMLVVEVVREPEFKRSGRAVLPADLPLPPSYWDDLEHWLKTLAPAKPAASKPEQAIKVGDTVMTTYDGVATVISMGHGEVMGDIATVRLANGYEGCTSVDSLKRIPQTEPAADGWHSEAPSVPGVYIADTKECVAESSERASRWLRYFDGVLWSNAWRESMSDIDKARTKSLRTGADIMWLRLIEADAPATRREIVDALLARLASTSSADGAALIGARQPAAELGHVVCIKSRGGSARVGDMTPLTKMPTGYYNPHPPEYWLPCDKDGWIPHTPTADSVCPVPSGVHFETLLGCNHNGLRSSRTIDGGYGGTGDCNGVNWDAGTSVIAWRPIAKDAS